MGASLHTSLVDSAVFGVDALAAALRGAAAQLAPGASGRPGHGVWCVGTLELRTNSYGAGIPFAVRKAGRFQAQNLPFRSLGVSRCDVGVVSSYNGASTGDRGLELQLYLSH